MIEKGDYIFDGFAHRQFDEETDGWMNTQMERELSVVQFAEEVLAMRDEINRLRKELWWAKKQSRL